MYVHKCITLLKGKINYNNNMYTLNIKNGNYLSKKDILMSKACTVYLSENLSFILYLLNDNYHDMN